MSKKIKDLGVCARPMNGDTLYRTKFKNSEDAQGHLDMLKRLDVVDTSYEVYECPECHLWHFGLKEWSK